MIFRSLVTDRSRHRNLPLLACRPVQAQGELAASPAEDADWWQKVWRAGATSVLVVSESVPWRTAVASLLESDGYAVRVDDSGDAALEPTCPYDLAVVDVAISGRSPTAVFAALRARSAIPLLAVSTDEYREPVVLQAFAAGADQFAPRALRSNELMARVRALLRRSPPRPRGDLDGDGQTSIRLDMTTRVAIVAGTSVDLSPRESEILYALLERPGRVVSRGELAGRHRGSHAERGLDSHVRQLRTKLERAEGRRRIVAIRGVGFRWAPDVEIDLRV